MMSLDKQIQWCIDKHKNTNHFYDTYLPYEFHLKMVATVCDDFKHLIPPFCKDLYVAACYGHDLIEDTRTSYNDCKEALGEQVADMIYAVTNEKGKNRKQRASDLYYAEMINVSGAVFIKLCDRIANVQYSKMTKSKMFEMYKRENYYFTSQLVCKQTDHLKEMFDYLNGLFKETEVLA